MSQDDFAQKIFGAIPRPNGPSWTEPETAGRGHNNKPESHNSHWTTKGAVSTPTTTTTATTEKRVSSRFIDGGRNSEGESEDKGGEREGELLYFTP